MLNLNHSAIWFDSGLFCSPMKLYIYVYQVLAVSPGAAILLDNLDLSEPKELGNTAFFVLIFSRVFQGNFSFALCSFSNLFQV